MLDKKMQVLLAAPNSRMVGGILRWTNNIYSYWTNNIEDNEISLSILDIARNRGGYYGQKQIQKILWAVQDYGKILFLSLKTLKHSEAEIFHLTTPGTFRLWMDYILLKQAKSRKIKTIIHFHFGRIPQLFENKNWEYRILCKVVKLADRAIVIDKNSYDSLVSAGFKNIDLLPNPLTPSVTKIISDNRDVIRKDNEIVFAGHVIPTKGVFELIEAIRNIKGIKLRIIGAVSEDMKRRLLSEAGNGNETWLSIEGEYSQEKIIKTMLAAGVFVLPTYTEGFPNVILESMACGCPIVTTDVGAIPEMLDIENGCNYGICVKPKDVDGLRNAVERMFNDRNYATTCGTNAQKRVVEQYSMPIVWSKLTTIWKSLKN